MISEVYNIDCLEYMKGLPDKFFQLAIVDPPYGIGMDGKIGIDGSGKAKNYTQKDWDNCAPPIEYFLELRRVSENQIIWGANHFISRIPYDSSCWLFWDKKKIGGFFADGELAWTSFNTSFRIFAYQWHGMLQQDMKNKEQRIHPTQKPIALYKWLLQNYAKKGDKIFDSHMGSQSSRLAAWEMGFDYYGCELDAEYFEQGNKRFELFKSQQSLFTPDEKQPVSIGQNLFGNDGVKPNRTLK